ncbi:MAG: TonB-dependent receptor [Proteobacteria bacterium]|nr:TonB-dependent receptor [Pseudomonadota bacterium]
MSFPQHKHPGQRRLWRLATGVLAVACTTAAPAEQGRPESGAQLEEIIVTATKRSSTVQETPMSITAISGEDIQARGVPDLTDLVQSVPGVSMRSSGPGQTELEMRGMSSAGGNSPTVGFYLDETPLTAPANAQNGKVVIDPNLYDISRVEVLRGPQGTLYGSGSMGGTIKLVPNAPDPRKFDASAEAIPSHTDTGGFNHAENAMINVPLAGDVAALRIVASASHDSGWIDRVVIADGAFPLETNNLTTRGNVLAAPVGKTYRGVNDASQYAARASLLWKATDALTIEPLLMYQRMYQGGLTQIDSNPGTNAHYQPFDAAEPYSDRFTLGALKLTYTFGAFDATSTTSRWVRDSELHQDGAEEFQWAFSVPDAIMPFYVSQGGFGPAVPTPVEYDNSSQTSEELRLTSTGSGPFKWLAGFFYSKFESCYCSIVLFPAAADMVGTANAFTQFQTTKITQNSVFGEVSYQLTPALKATAGLRRYSYRSEVDAATSGFVSISGSDQFVYAQSPERNTGINPKVDLSYQVDPNLLLYATAAKGFRPGGGNQPVPTSGPLGDVCEANLQANHGTTAFVPSPLTFGPDSVWSYELGEKAQLLDRRLTLNSAAYFERWGGTQQNVPLPCGYPYTANAGVAHVYGAELEFNALLAPGLLLSLNGTYTHATFAVGSLEASIAEGTRVQDVPDHTATMSLAYRHPLTAGIAYTARIDHTYVASRTDVTYAVNHLPSYDLTNARAGLEGEHWSSTLFVRNAFNKRAILGDAFQLNLNIPTFNRVVVSQPLTVGLDLTYRY